MATFSTEFSRNNFFQYSRLNDLEPLSPNNSKDDNKAQSNQSTALPSVTSVSSNVLNHSRAFLPSSISIRNSSIYPRVIASPVTIVPIPSVPMRVAVASSLPVVMASSIPLVVALPINQSNSSPDLNENKKSNVPSLEDKIREEKLTKIPKKFRDAAQSHIKHWNKKRILPRVLYRLNTVDFGNVLWMLPRNEILEFLNSRSSLSFFNRCFCSRPQKSPTMLEYIFSKRPYGDNFAMEAMIRLTPEELIQILFTDYIHKHTGPYSHEIEGNIRQIFTRLPNEKFQQVMSLLRSRLEGDDFHRYYLKYLSGEKLVFALTITSELSAYSNFRYVLSRQIDFYDRIQFLEPNEFSKLIRETQVHRCPDVYPAFSELCRMIIKNTPNIKDYTPNVNWIQHMFDGLIHCDHPNGIPNGPLPQFFDCLKDICTSSDKDICSWLNHSAFINDSNIRKTEDTLTDTDRNTVSSSQIFHNKILKGLMSLKGNSEHFSLFYFLVKSGNKKIIEAYCRCGLDRFLEHDLLRNNTFRISSIDGPTILMLWEEDALRQLFTHIPLNMIQQFSISGSHPSRSDKMFTYLKKLKAAIEGMDSERVKVIHLCHPHLKDVS